MTDLLSNLIQSKVKRKLLRLFLFNKNKKFHTRELSRIIEEPISAVQREVKKLVALQLIIKYPEGNLINYFVNTQNPFFEEVKTLILKTTTEPKDFFKMLINTKSLAMIALFGECVRNPMKFSEPVKLFIVGSMPEEGLHDYLKAIMDIFNRDYELLYVDKATFDDQRTKDKKIIQILTGKSTLVLKDEIT
jgi:predicted transcriptional regulator